MASKHKFKFDVVQIWLCASSETYDKYARKRRKWAYSDVDVMTIAQLCAHKHGAPSSFSICFAQQIAKSKVKRWIMWRVFVVCIEKLNLFACMINELQTYYEYREEKYFPILAHISGRSDGSFFSLSNRYVSLIWNLSHWQWRPNALAGAKKSNAINGFSMEHFNCESVHKTFIEIVIQFACLIDGFSSLGCNLPIFLQNLYDISIEWHIKSFIEFIVLFVRLIVVCVLVCCNGIVAVNEHNHKHIHNTS